MVHFVGAGPGAPDLITVRGKTLLEEADMIIYAGSLVNPQLLDYATEKCKIYDSSKMTLEQVIFSIRQAEAQGQTTVRLHTGYFNCQITYRRPKHIWSDQGTNG